jgi:hypothetical protein
VDVADQPVLDAEVVRVGGSSRKVAERLDGADGLVDDNASNRRLAASSAEAFDGAFARGRRAAAGARLGGATAAAVARRSTQAAWYLFWEATFYEIELEGRAVMSYVEGTSLYPSRYSYLPAVCSLGQTWAFFWHLLRYP